MRTGADGEGEADAARGGIQALDSALVLLRAMARLPGPAALGEIARAAAMPPSKAHRYLASFVRAGLAAQSHRAGHYELARGAVEIGLAAMARMDQVAAAGERLEDLVRVTGAAALVAVWGPHGPTIVRWRRTGSFVVTALGLGTTMPLLSSATGRIFLAFSPSDVTASILATEIAEARRLGLSWPDFDPADGAAPQRLRAALRAAGHASVDGRFIPGLNAISAPVLNWQGEAGAALTLTAGDPALLDPDGPALAALLGCCAELSVGATGP